MFALSTECIQDGSTFPQNFEVMVNIRNGDFDQDLSSNCNMALGLDDIEDHYKYILGHNAEIRPHIYRDWAILLSYTLNLNLCIDICDSIARTRIEALCVSFDFSLSNVEFVPTSSVVNGHRLRNDDLDAGLVSNNGHGTLSCEDICACRDATKNIVGAFVYLPHLIENVTEAVTTDPLVYAMCVFLRQSILCQKDISPFTLIVGRKNAPALKYEVCSDFSTSDSSSPTCSSIPFWSIFDYETEIEFSEDCAIYGKLKENLQIPRKEAFHASQKCVMSRICRQEASSAPADCEKLILDNSTSKHSIPLMKSDFSNSPIMNCKYLFDTSCNPNDIIARQERNIIFLQKKLALVTEKLKRFQIKKKKIHLKDAAQQTDTSTACERMHDDFFYTDFTLNHVDKTNTFDACGKSQELDINLSPITAPTCFSPFNRLDENRDVGKIKQLELLQSAKKEKKIKKRTKSTKSQNLMQMSGTYRTTNWDLDNENCLGNTVRINTLNSSNSTNDEEDEEGLTMMRLEAKYLRGSKLVAEENLID